MRLIGYQYFTNKETGKRSLMLYLTRPIKGEGNGECFVSGGSKERPVFGLFASPACKIPTNIIGEEVSFIYQPNEYGSPQIVQIIKA